MPRALNLQIFQIVSIWADSPIHQKLIFKKNAPKSQKSDPMGPQLQIPIHFGSLLEHHFLLFSQQIATSIMRKEVSADKAAEEEVEEEEKEEGEEEQVSADKAT